MRQEATGGLRRAPRTWRGGKRRRKGREKSRFFLFEGNAGGVSRALKERKASKTHARKAVADAPQRATRRRTKPRRVRASELPRGMLPPRERGRAQAIAREVLRRRRVEQARRITKRNPAVKSGSVIRLRNGERKIPKSGDGRTSTIKEEGNQGENPPRRGGTQARGIFPLIPHIV